ncbi:hypothetical protein Bca4012_051182 [Brassica carinata]|uniref:Uncharacterized protein n=1 Tax=Brassica carinata TaxID=52824 RepID=A0A8X7R636_BRACI|nr:hypothetical protein Bca52824_053825 [Brassica carinata]
MRAGRRSRVAPSRVTLSVPSLRDAGKGTRVSSTRVKTSSSSILVRAASNISSAPAGVSDSIPVSANDEVLSSAYIKEKTLKNLSKQQLMGPYAMKKVQIQNKEQLELIMFAEGMSKLEGIGSTERERLWPELVQSFKDIFQRLKLNKVEEAEEAWWWWSRHRLHIRRSMARDKMTKGW